MKKQEIKVGAKYRIELGDRMRVYHVRAIVDGDQIVVRRYSKVKRRWDYLVERKSFLQLLPEFSE